MNVEYKIDAANQSMGRVASEAASFLMGKNDVDFAKNKVAKVSVTVVNVAKLKISASKAIQKKYYRHSGYIGSLKERSLKEMIERDAEGLFRSVVSGMLPDNKLLKLRMKKLKVEL